MTPHFVAIDVSGQIKATVPGKSSLEQMYLYVPGDTSENESTFPETQELLAEFNTSIASPTFGIYAPKNSLEV